MQLVCEQVPDKVKLLIVEGVVALDPSVCHVIVLDHVVLCEVLLQELSNFIDALDGSIGAVVGKEACSTIEQALSLADHRVVVTVLFHRISSVLIINLIIEAIRFFAGIGSLCSPTLRVAYIINTVFFPLFQVQRYHKKFIPPNKF